MMSRPWHAHYDAGVPISLTTEPRTVPDLLGDSARRFPGRDAIRFLGARLSYAELDDAASRFAGALASFGIGRGARVAVQLPNLPQSVIAFSGTLRAGATVVMSNPLATAPEIEQQWTDA